MHACACVRVLRVSRLGTMPIVRGSIALNRHTILRDGQGAPFIVRTREAPEISMPSDHSVYEGMTGHSTVLN